MKEKKKKRYELKDFIKLFLNIVKYVIENSIFFGKSLFQQLRKFSTDINFKDWQYHNAEDFLKDPFGVNSMEYRKQKVEQQLDILLSFMHESPKIIEKLEDEFRKLLVVDEPIRNIPESSLRG